MLMNGPHYQKHLKQSQHRNTPKLREAMAGFGAELPTGRTP
jgi:hypothetical protein